MKLPVYVFDPTISDSLSKVRGIGRYMQILRENFTDKFIFINNLSSIIHHQSSIFINPFFNFLAPPLMMRRLAKKQIAVIHDLIPLKYPRHFPVGIKGNINVFLNKLALKNYDVIVTDSETSKKDIVQMLHMNENIVKVIYPCLPEIFNQVSSIKKQVLSMNNFNTKYLLLNTNFCLYVGDTTWNKNLVNLARAIKKINVTCVFVGKVFTNLESRIQSLELQEKQIQNSKFNSEFSIINSKFLSHPWQTELKEFSKEVNGDKRFIFAGFVPDNELINLYQQTRCNILPSRDEGFGFSYVESGSQQCPSVLSDIPILKEISGEKALFADPEKPDEIANTIGELYFNDAKRKKIGDWAFKRSLFFSSSNFKKSFLNLLKNL